MGFVFFAGFCVGCIVSPLFLAWISQDGPP